MTAFQERPRLRFLCTTSPPTSQPATQEAYLLAVTTRREQQVRLGGVSAKISKPKEVIIYFARIRCSIYRSIYDFIECKNTFSMQKCSNAKCVYWPDCIRTFQLGVVNEFQYQNINGPRLIYGAVCLRAVSPRAVHLQRLLLPPPSLQPIKRTWWLCAMMERVVALYTHYTIINMLRNFVLCLTTNRCSFSLLQIAKGKNSSIKMTLTTL